MNASPPDAGSPWGRFRRTLTQFDPGKVNAARGLRNALGVALPLAAGAAMGRVLPALVMAAGALNVGFADGTEPYAVRVRRMLAASALVALAVFCGSISGWHPVAALAILALWTFGAGMLVSLGVQAGNLGVSCTCVLLVFASRPLGFRQAALCGLLALGGGLLEALFSALLWPVRPFEPESLALAELYASLARMSGRRVAATDAPPATGDASAASEALGARKWDHSISGERFRSLLDQAERIRVCLLTLGMLRERLNEDAAALLDEHFAAARRTLEAAAEMLRTGRRWKGEVKPAEEAERILDKFRTLPGAQETEGANGDARLQMDALTRQLRVTFDLANNATPSGIVAFARSEAARPWRLRVGGALGTLRPNLNLRSTAFRHALRLAVCVTAADALGRGLGWNRPYWLPLTVVVVLKPDFSSTFSRGVLRLGGTFAGLGIATGLFHWLPRTLPVEIGLIAVVTFILRWSGPAHYGVLAMSVSELVVLLVALTGVQPGQVILARARNTALGGVLALLAYLLWPTWERTQVGEVFARMLDAYRRHFELMASAFAGETAELTAAMNRTRSVVRLARMNLEASVDRLAAEPGTTPQERERWQSILASAHILSHAVIMLHATLVAAPETVRPLGGSEAFRVFVGAVTKTLEELAAAARGAKSATLEFPDLREAHYRLIHAGEAMAAPHTLISMETDRMVNSLNTMREQVVR